MNLKLAEYNLETGKFEGFLELGENFLFAGNSIVVIKYSSLEDLVISMDPIFIDEFDKYFKKDQKDPLNRFDGLFDGRTYGEGRFVLIVNDEDDVFEIWQQNKEVISSKYKIISEEVKNSELLGYNINKNILLAKTTGKLVKTKFNGNQIWEESLRFKKSIGNLHENPELWGKVK